MRKQNKKFSFFETFYTLIKEGAKDDKERLKLYDAIFEYAFADVEPTLSKMPLAIFDTVRVSIDCSRKRQREYQKSKGENTTICEQIANKLYDKLQTNCKQIDKQIVIQIVDKLYNNCNTNCNTNVEQIVNKLYDKLSDNSFYNIIISNSISISNIISLILKDNNIYNINKPGIVTDIRNTYPRCSYPNEAEKSIVNAAKRLFDAKRFATLDDALSYIKERTDRFAEVRNGKKKYTPDACRWFDGNGFDADEATWQTDSENNNSNSVPANLPAYEKNERGA